jgi:hypothetical protein
MNKHKSHNSGKTLKSVLIAGGIIIGALYCIQSGDIQEWSPAKHWRYHQMDKKLKQIDLEYRIRNNKLTYDELEKFIEVYKKDDTQNF